MALKATFERVIEKACHTTGNTGIMGDGFGQLTPFEILQRLRKTYGRANIQEIQAKLPHLNNPIDRNLPVKVMIRDIEDVQHFLLANPTNNMELTDVQLCTHGLIKLSKNRLAICKRHRKVEPQGQGHPPAMDEIQNPFYCRVRKDARRKWRNNHGPRGIWNRRGI